MSNDYQGQDPIVIAKQAERDLNSHQAKHGVSTADSSEDTPNTFPLPHTQLIPLFQPPNPASTQASRTNSPAAQSKSVPPPQARATIAKYLLTKAEI